MKTLEIVNLLKDIVDLADELAWYANHGSNTQLAFELMINPVEVQTIRNQLAKVRDKVHFEVYHRAEPDSDHPEQSADWQTQTRGTNNAEYEIYLACADDGHGIDMTTGKPLKSYDDWLAA